MTADVYKLLTVLDDVIGYRIHVVTDDERDEYFDLGIKAGLHLGVGDWSCKYIRVRDVNGMFLSDFEVETGVVIDDYSDEVMQYVESGDSSCISLSSLKSYIDNGCTW